jgi:CelD/BcsL family acetyltransferase involved in cellulose biosynthesis
VDAFKRRFTEEEIAVAGEFTFQPRSPLATLTGAARRIGRGMGADRIAAAASLNTTTRMQHKIIEEDAEFDALATQWNALLAVSGNDLLPLTHSWTRIWWKHFGDGARRQVHCFFRDGRLVAVAPMMLAKTRYRGMGLRQLVSMANGHTPHAGLLHEQSMGAGGITDIVRTITRTSGANLTGFLRVPEADELCMLVRNQTSFDGHRLGLRRSVATPLIRIDSDWETFFATRSQKFRKNMRNKANKFARAPGCRIERRVVTSADDKTLDEMQEVSRHSWKGKAGTDLASVPAARAFLRDLMEVLGPADGVHVWIAWSGSQPIAFEFHARYGGVTYPLRADFDERFRELSPGSVVEYTALRESFEEGAMKLYDSCANDYWYLSNWTDEVRVHFDIEIFGRGPRAWLAHAAEFHIVPLARQWRDRMRGKPEENPAQPAASH